MTSLNKLSPLTLARSPSAVVQHSARRPFSELVLPILHQRHRQYEDERPGQFTQSETIHKYDYLNRFTETHVVRQNTIVVGMVQTEQPIQPRQLVLFQGQVFWKQSGGFGGMHHAKGSALLVAASVLQG